VIWDMFPAPSTNGVSEVYQWLKSILSTATAQQAESSLQHRVKGSILPPPIPRMGDKGPPKGLWMWERLPRWQDFQPATVSADQTLGWNLRYTDGTAHGMTTHSPSSACETHDVGVVMIVKDVASVLKGLARRRLEASCAMLIPRGIFER
jgi:hypothetical protein